MDNQFKNQDLYQVWAKRLKSIKPNHDKLALYLVGGCVRDILLKRRPKDIDIVCHDAKNVARQLSVAHDLRLIVFDKKPDQPCYRLVDRWYPDVYVDIAPMVGGAIESDLRRRDFTVNAIAMEFKADNGLGEIIDPFHGQKDLSRKCIRTVEDDAFDADPLRMLRAVRFCASLGFSIEPLTSKRIQEKCHQISRIAFERIQYELMEILASGCSAKYIRLMDTLGLLEELFPEIIPMKSCQQNGWHHLDVWQHSLAVVENCDQIIGSIPHYFEPVSSHVQKYLKTEKRDVLLKLAALFHDAGKPVQKKVSSQAGRITFYGHQAISTEIAERIANRLRLSNREKKYLMKVISEHMHPLHLSEPRVKPTTITRWFRDHQSDCIAIMIHSMADVMAALGPESNPEFRERHIQWCRQTVTAFYQRIQPQLTRKPLIDGRDLLALGFRQGIELGKVLKQVRQAQDNGDITTRQQALDMAKAFLNR